jgi:mono/diheme cytochrome c family protein
LSFSWRLAAALVAILLIVAAAVVLMHDPVEPGSGPIAEVDLAPAELVARGEYLARAGNCASCHTAPGGAFMAGGLAFETPFGVVHATNITPDPATGIGDWSGRDFLNALRHGRRPDGDHLYPAFPYTAYTKVSNADAAALWAYLRSIPPVEQPNPDNEMTFPFGFRPLLAGWKFLFHEPGAFEPDPAQDADWNRGAYLVEALGHCSACHSPRNLLGGESRSAAYAGGEYLDAVPGGAYQPWSAPNLTSSERGLGLWSHQDLSDYLKTARNSFLESFGPMNEVIMNSTRHLSVADVDAMATYLKSLPAVDEPAGAEPDAQVMGRGRTVYNLHCGTCHLPTGLGDPEMGPQLDRGSLVVQDSNPASMLNATPEALSPRWRHPMDEFQWLLDDEEIAAVATFVRHSWGNDAGAVTPEQVARQR